MSYKFYQGFNPSGDVSIGIKNEVTNTLDTISFGLKDGEYHLYTTPECFEDNTLFTHIKDAIRVDNILFESIVNSPRLSDYETPLPKVSLEFTASNIREAVMDANYKTYKCYVIRVIKDQTKNMINYLKNVIHTEDVKRECLVFSGRIIGYLEACYLGDTIEEDSLIIEKDVGAYDIHTKDFYPRELVNAYIKIMQHEIHSIYGWGTHYDVDIMHHAISKYKLQVIDAFANIIADAGGPTKINYIDRIDYHIPEFPEKN